MGPEGVPVWYGEGPCTGEHLCEQTDTYENITFPQLRWRAVIIPMILKFIIDFITHGNMNCSWKRIIIVIGRLHEKNNRNIELCKMTFYFHYVAHVFINRL